MKVLEVFMREISRDDEREIKHLKESVDNMLKRGINMPLMFDKYFMYVVIDSLPAMDYFHRLLFEGLYTGRQRCNQSYFENGHPVIVITLSEALGFINMITPPYKRADKIKELKSTEDVCKCLSDILVEEDPNKQVTAAAAPVELFINGIINRNLGGLFDGINNETNKLNEYITKMIELNRDKDVVAYVMNAVGDFKDFNRFRITHENTDDNMCTCVFACKDPEDMCNLIKESYKEYISPAFELNAIGQIFIGNEVYHCFVMTFYDISNPSVYVDKETEDPNNWNKYYAERKPFPFYTINESYVALDKLK